MESIGPMSKRKDMVELSLKYKINLPVNTLAQGNNILQVKKQRRRLNEKEIKQGSGKMHVPCFIKDLISHSIGYIYSYAGKLTAWIINFPILMLLVDKKQVKLPKRYQKVLNLAPALDNSIVFLGIAGFRQDCLSHISHDGKLLGEIIFEQNMDSFALLSDRQVMVLETRKNNLLIWNLVDHTRIDIPFQFKAEESDQSFIHIFPESSLCCVHENGRYNNNTFKLTYFAYPFTAETQVFHEWESEEVWTYEYMVRKANNHSTICWFKGRHDDGFEIRTYDLKEDPTVQEGHYKRHQRANQIGKPYGVAKCEVAITTLWEMRPDEYLLVCISNRTEPKDQPINNNYIWDIKLDTMREAKFNFGQYQDLHLDQHNFGNTCMFRTFDFENGQAIETPVHYINNETEEIIATEMWKCSYLYKYEFPGYDGNMIVEGQYENGNVEEVTICSKKIMDPKEISIHFMNEIIDNVDFDLAYAVTNIIDYGK